MTLKNYINALFIKRLSFLNVVVDSLAIIMVIFELTIRTKFHTFLVVAIILMAFNIFINLANFLLSKGSLKLRYFISSKMGKLESTNQRKKIPPKPITPDNYNESNKSAKFKIEHPTIKIKSNDNKDFNSNEDVDLGVPEVPEPPKKKQKLSIESENVSIDVLNKIKENKDKQIEMILVNCERCKRVIAVPVPHKLVKSSNLPVIPISYIHKNEHEKDQHCITIYIDRDFDVRRQRLSDVVF
ncbi:MAG: hypothetical protein P8Y70_17065 [Candidatus Lokiarchaeota archaeon]